MSMRQLTWQHVTGLFANCRRRMLELWSILYVI